MKKKIAAAFLAGILCFSILLGGCNDSAARSMKTSQKSSSVPMSSAALSSGEILTEGVTEQESIELLTPILSEFGETNPIENMVLDAPGKAVDGEETIMQVVHFSVGNRNLQANILISSDKTEIYSISEESEISKYYYNLGIEAVRDLGGDINIGSLYDYHTGEKIDLDASSQAAIDDAFQGVMDIIQKIPHISQNAEGSKDGSLELDVNIDTSSMNGTDDYATAFYYDALTFLSDYIALEPLPYETLAFNIVIDNKNVGVMIMYSAPEAGLFGTIPPVIIDDSMKDSFSQKYDEFMSSIDSEKIKGE